MTNRSPDLRFGPGNNQGFTGVGVATFDNLRPATVVRELIQNALDAASDANVRTAVVRFRLSKTQRDKIPGIESYKRAFEDAVEAQRHLTNGELPGQAQLVVNRIGGTLKKVELDVLTVFDNGIGLDKQRMNALMSDGLSAKDGNAAGTYGNGHATAIPASDLRYVLYGGLTKDGSRIGAGHAVLASHLKDGEAHVRSGDGFYIRDFQASLGNLYNYASGGDLGCLIADAVDDIECRTGHGSAIIIPAFNNFLERDPLKEMVFRAASANFFVAIEDGKLEVTVEDCRQEGSDQWVLDKSRLREVLGAYQNNQRARAILSGRRAFEAHKAYQTGDEHCVKTAEGSIGIRLLETRTGVHRVDMCRNGMWIADDKKIPGFYQKFVGKVPFQAVLSLDADKGRNLYNFIRLAEGPLHDSILVKRLPVSDQQKCKNALQEIVKWILNKTPSVKSEAYAVDDFLRLDFGDEGGKGAGKPRRGFWGVPVVVKKGPSPQIPLSEIDDDSNDGDPDPNSNSKRPSKRPKENSKRRRRRPALPTFFQAVSRPVGKKRWRILVECAKDCTNAELRLVVDEALDATCERHGQDPYSPAVLSNVTIDGSPVSECNFVRWNEGVIGVRLGDLKVNDSIEIEADYRLTGDFTNLPTPSLRTEVLRSEQHPSTTHSGAHQLKGVS